MWLRLPLPLEPLAASLCLGFALCFSQLASTSASASCHCHGFEVHFVAISLALSPTQTPTIFLPFDALERGRSLHLPKSRLISPFSLGPRPPGYATVKHHPRSLPVPFVTPFVPCCHSSSCIFPLPPEARPPPPPPLKAPARRWRSRGEKADHRPSAPAWSFVCTAAAG